MIRFFDLPFHYRLNYQKNSNILADNYKVIYFNTQKNANSSMKAQFVELLGLPKSKDFPKDIHYNYNFPAATQLETNTIYQSYLKFAILRNPWERLASCYNNKIKEHSTTGPDYILACSNQLYIGMPFEEFVDVICDIPDSEADFHFCSQAYLMLYSDGTFPMNYLCNMENLAFHIEDIKSKTGIPFASLPQLNSSESSRFETMYTPSLIKRVAQRYHTDIVFFNYKFGEKNQAFTFGTVSDEWLDSITEHPLMLSLLKEKSKELLQQLALKRVPQTREMKTLKKELEEKTKELEAIKASISWKITAPLRKLFSH